MIGLSESFRDRPAKQDPLFLPRQAERIFSSHGALVSAMGLEHREQQEVMALNVAQAFSTDSVLLFEAPTGVGKSLAYLMPGIVHAMEHERQLIVSTHTKALQEQVRQKDLELCRKVFKSSEGLGGYGEFRAAVLMGKGNYVCGTRLREALLGQQGLFDGPMLEELERIRKWQQESGTGLLHELTPPPMPDVWEQISAESPACNNRNCSPETCHYRRARREVEKAHVLIVNHSLLFTLIAAGYAPREDVAGVLHPGDFVVLDEAHTVPGVATEHFGIGVSDYALRRQLLKLYNPATRKGLLVRHKVQRALDPVRKALDEVTRFFVIAADEYLEKSEIVRIPAANWAEPILHQPLAEVVSHVSSAAKQMDEGPARDELSGAATLIANYNGSINDCIALEQKDHVYWIERTGRRGTISLRSAPLDVAPYLRKRLFSRKTSVVLTSATLDDGDGMDNFAARTGATGAERDMVDSPFDLENSVRVFVADDAPETSQGRLDLDWLADMICYCTLHVAGGSLVLFTSHRDMREVAAKLEEPFSVAKRPLLVQGVDAAPSELRRRFAEAGNAVLLGTDSFWTGIDVPGPALSQVVVTRLPFENPTHPVAEARAQWLQARGDNPFLKITVPDAVTKFRQGIGRLIRSRQDLGTLTLLDTRVLTREYGRRFLSVLPGGPRYTRFSLKNRSKVFKPLESEAGRRQFSGEDGDGR